MQVRNERAQRAENLARAMDGRYHTSQDKAEMQRIENGWAKRFAWREAHGQEDTFLPEWRSAPPQD